MLIPMLDKMNDSTYTDPCTIAMNYESQTDQLFREVDEMYRESMCWEEQLSNEEYLDKLDRKLYQRSHGY